MLSNIVESPYFKEGVFIFAVLLLLGSFKFSLEGVLE